ncbi:hypothetical protein JTE90_009602 [Oedothorax gibbosus]|uniref:Uncharacterized protein n=1 Tax=Oedothorax gibbosus TaxID=931172 RepID=A0AAV6VIM0_9ARAC|nr:hypothetical protein JTE90_009602 [Oedothorax gibbosus]
MMDLHSRCKKKPYKDDFFASILKDVVPPGIKSTTKTNSSDTTSSIFLQTFSFYNKKKVTTAEKQMRMN